jgi:CRISPR system Cascade subunit CasD
MDNTLFLRLESPLQAWGERARWSVRDTAPEPTKSGVVGLLGCALGWSTDEDLRRLSAAVRLGVRCDRPGVVLVDYHTVIGGVTSAEGRIKINANTKEPETVVSLRAYLCDASFLAAVQSTPEWITQLAKAVQAPVWTLYLGRKSCPPAMPVYAGEGEFPDLEAALRSGLAKGVRVRAVIECKPQQGVQRRDEVGSNRLHTFLPRYTREIWLGGAPSPQESA